MWYERVFNRHDVSIVHSYVSVLLVWQLLSLYISHTITSLNFQEWSRDHRVVVKGKPSICTNMGWGCSGRLVEASPGCIEWECGAVALWGRKKYQIKNNSPLLYRHISPVMSLFKLLQTGQPKQQMIMSHISGGWEVQDQGLCSFSVWRGPSSWFINDHFLTVLMGLMVEGFLCSLFWGIDPIHEAAILMT